MSGETDDKDFDFEDHKRKAIESYTNIKKSYDSLCVVLKNIVEQSLKDQKLQVHSLEARAKDVKSFSEKAAKPDPDNPKQPKYRSPLSEIQDLAGVRVITFFPFTVNQVNKIIEAEFDVLEKSDKSEILDQEERLGYQSVHYVVKLSGQRSALTEYKAYKDMVAEIQVRTILQHAWAEIEHDIEYKSALTIPVSIKRRFMALAGLLEIADREFQSILDDDKKLRSEARKSVSEGNLKNVELTSDALKALLNKRYGEDGRMSEFSYSFTVKVLVKLGFTTLEQIDQILLGYDQDKISKLIWGKKRGQITRFEDVLLAALGENYKRNHPWNNEVWFAEMCERRIKLMAESGVDVGRFSYLVERKN